jgi:hypothetical protein
VPWYGILEKKTSLEASPCFICPLSPRNLACYTAVDYQRGGRGGDHPTLQNDYLVRLLKQAIRHPRSVSGCAAGCPAADAGVAARPRHVAAHADRVGRGPGNGARGDEPGSLPLCALVARISPGMYNYSQ